jgi:hypothetical protein
LLANVGTAIPSLTQLASSSYRPQKKGGGEREDSNKNHTETPNSNWSTANLSPPKKNYKNTTPKRERKTHTALNTQKTQRVIAPRRERKMTNNSSSINTHFSIHHKFRKQNKHTNHQQLSSTLYSLPCSCFRNSGKV